MATLATGKQAALDKTQAEEEIESEREKIAFLNGYPTDVIAYRAPVAYISLHSNRSISVDLAHL